MIPEKLHQPERSLISPDAGNMIVQNGLVAISVVRQDKLFPQNVSQASRRGLRHHGATFFREFPRKSIVDLLLPLQLLELLCQDSGKFCWRKLVRCLCGNPATQIVFL